MKKVIHVLRLTFFVVDILWRVWLQATATGAMAPFYQNKQQMSKKRSPNWKWKNFFQQTFLGKWLKQMWFSDKRRISFVSLVSTEIQVQVILVSNGLMYSNLNIILCILYYPVLCCISQHPILWSVLFTKNQKNISTLF